MGVERPLELTRPKLRVLERTSGHVLVEGSQEELTPLLDEWIQAQKERLFLPGSVEIRCKFLTSENDNKLARISFEHCSDVVRKYTKTDDVRRNREVALRLEEEALSLLCDEVFAEQLQPDEAQKLVDMLQVVADCSTRTV